MKNLKLLVGLLIATIAYCYLMWYEELGLNAVIFSTLLIVTVGIYKKAFRSAAFLISGAMFFTASLGVLITGLEYSKVIYYFSLITFMGVAQTPQIKNIFYSGISSFINFFIGVVPVSGLVLSVNENSSVKWAKKNIILKILITTVTFVLFFFLFYTSNPKFAQLCYNVFNPILSLISKISFINIFHFVFIFYFLALFVVKIRFDHFYKLDSESSDDIMRKRKIKLPYSRNPGMGLKDEYKTAKLIIASIGGLLLVLNLTDVFSVWSGIVPDSASELSEFVHSGTYILIFSVLLSILLLLLFFRQNINLYPSNKSLKVLSYFWISQNIFLLFSVGLRNYHYVAGYGLTYKRIEVFMVLLLICIALILLLLKIKNKKTLYYYIKMCSFATLILVCCSSLFNWDIIIAKNNTNAKYYTKNNADYRYIRSLSNQAKPYLEDYSYSDDSSFADYAKEVKARSWKSFNFGDYCAVKKIEKEKN